MPKLILDLDLTVFATEDDLRHLSAAHTLSPKYTAWLGLNKSEALVQLINPYELSVLIETACEQYDGIIILTSGGWHDNVRNMLADCLDLSDKATEMVQNCLFISPLTCQKHFINNSLFIIREMSKNRRFSKYLEQDASLRAQQFVFLDDNYLHIDSFANSKQVIPILAATMTGRKDFYQTAMDALQEAKVKERIMRRYQSDKSFLSENEQGVDLIRGRLSAAGHLLFTYNPVWQEQSIAADELSEVDEEEVGAFVLT